MRQDRDHDFVYDRYEIPLWPLDDRYMMAGALPAGPRRNRSREVPERRDELLAEEFFQPRGRCPSPSAVSERVILGLEHGRPPREGIKVAQSQRPSEVKKVFGFDGAFNSTEEAHSNDNTSLAAKLPTELVQMIYRYLGTTDFNAARHTCRNWHLASLTPELLAEQIKRGGWWSAAPLGLFKPCDRSALQTLDRFMARECALAGEWTGRGLSDEDSLGRYHNPVIECGSVDFEALCGRVNSTRVEPICISSFCGEHFMLAVESEVYIYRIFGERMALTFRECFEKRVVAMAMDVSDDHFAIAVLLEGRVGAYIDLSEKYQSSLPASACPASRWESAGTINNTADEAAPIMDLRAAGDQTPTVVQDVPVGDLDEVSTTAESIGERTILHQSVEIAMQRRWTHYYHASRARLRGMRRMPAQAERAWPLESSVETPVPVARQRTVYRNLCTSEDPPVSIGISPVQQCVAFGSRGGIELYWIDPQKGQHLNRWFPLIKPSEHLYFLRPRRHIDAQSRLRVISSTSFLEPNGDAEDDGQHEVASSAVSSWFTLSASWQTNASRGAKKQAQMLDHSHAVPLNDGHHILFLDNATGLLCLGCDKPVGSLYRLSRKIVFLPPSQTQLKSTTVAHVFATSNDTSVGVRVIAAYADHIVLYSVPADVLEYSTAEQESTVQPSEVPFHALENVSVLKHPCSNAGALMPHFFDASARFHQVNMKWIHHLPSNGERAKSLEDLWPMRIEGTVIGRLEGVASLAVQESELHGLTVWAFSKSGAAKAWKIDNGERPTVHLRYRVDREGFLEAQTHETARGRWKGNFRVRSRSP